MHHLLTLHNSRMLTYQTSFVAQKDCKCQINFLSAGIYFLVTIGLSVEVPH